MERCTKREIGSKISALDATSSWPAGCLLGPSGQSWSCFGKHRGGPPGDPARAVLARPDSGPPGRARTSARSPGRRPDCSTVATEPSRPLVIARGRARSRGLERLADHAVSRRHSPLRASRAWQAAARLSSHGTARRPLFAPSSPRPCEAMRALWCGFVFAACGATAKHSKT